MKNNLQKRLHACWGTIVGYEKDIRLAALKDEIEHLKSKLNNEDTSVSILETTISVLEHRIKELS